MAINAGIHDVSITPNREQEVGDDYYVLPFAVRGTTTFEQFCDFLYVFHSIDLLHHMSSVHFESAQSADGPVLTGILQIEAIALKQGVERSTLLPDESGIVAERLAERSRKDFPALAASDPFPRPGPRMGDNPKPPRQRPVRTTPQKDRTKSVSLVGIFIDGSDSEAWVYDEKQQDSTIVCEGEELSVAGIAAQVLRIEPNSVLLEVAGTPKRWEPGESLDRAQDRDAG